MAIEIEEARRGVVAPHDIDEISQVDGTAAGDRDEDLAQLLLARELARRIDADVLAARLEDSSGERDVPVVEHLLESRRADAVGRQPLLGVVEEDALLDDTGDR